METVILSSTLEVKIPQEICQALHLAAGEKLRILQFGNRVELIPARSLEELYGFVPGMDTRIDRDGDPV